MGIIQGRAIVLVALCAIPLLYVVANGVGGILIALYRARIDNDLHDYLFNANMPPIAIVGDCHDSMGARQMAATIAAKE